MKLLLTLAYDGTLFNGYATQLHQNTIQDTLEAVLTKIYHQPIKTLSVSRTDSKVHALDQKVLINPPFVIGLPQLQKALNTLLPASILITEIIKVPTSFHVHKNCKQKTYKYYLTKQQNPFNKNYKVYFPYHLDIKRMQKASKVLLGKHDFSAFCGAKSAIKDKTRNLYEIKIQEIDNDIVFTITGDGFLYNMVRIIVGCLVDVGLGKTNQNDLLTILESKNRSNAGKTFPPQGLYLYKVVLDLENEKVEK